MLNFYVRIKRLNLEYNNKFNSVAATDVISSFL